MTIAIIQATANDAAALTAVAQAAKAHWGYPKSWLDAWKPQLTITPEYITASEVFVARVQDQIVGFYGLNVSAGELELTHLWVLPGYMGQGLGLRLFQHAAGTASSLGFRQFRIESDPHAEGFYLRAGARSAGSVEGIVEGTTRRLPLLVYDIAALRRGIKAPRGD
jgi:GNAT superfamily N-acetyltransferase